MMRCPRSTRGGFTLLEALIALSVLGLVLGNVVMMLRSSNDAYDVEAGKAQLELQIDQTLDRIVLALMGASTDSLDPNSSMPAFHDELTFQQSLGFANGELLFGAQERIELALADGEVIWREKPGEVDERSVTWSRWVARFLEGELMNGVDDNANGLIDESGLVFLVEGAQVTVHLTMQRVDTHGRTTTYSRTAVVHCRNT
jgi:prepilin-type N-terminal cleavage/methylation domain-containing protein